MSILYRPSNWVRCPRTGRMVRVTTGKRVKGLMSKAPIPSQLAKFGR